MWVCMCACVFVGGRGGGGLISCSLRSTVGRNMHISMQAIIGTISREKAMNFMQKVTK